MEAKLTQDDDGGVVLPLSDAQPPSRKADMNKILVTISKHLRENNSRQIETLSEAASLRAEVKKSHIRIVWLAIAVFLLLGVVVTQTVRQEMSIRRLTMVERRFQQSVVRQADIARQSAKNADEMGKAREDLQDAQATLDRLSNEVPQLRVDGFGRIFLDVTVQNELDASRLRKARGRGRPVISKDAKRASLPMSAGRIQVQ